MIKVNERSLKTVYGIKSLRLRAQIFFGNKLHLENILSSSYRGCYAFTHQAIRLHYGHRD